MSKIRKATVSVKGTDITVLVFREQDYISLHCCPVKLRSEFCNTLIR